VGTEQQGHLLMTAATSAGPDVVAVTCLAFEGRIARRSGVAVLCNGRREHLRDQVERAAERACGLISFGVAGGLDPGLRSGDWVVAANVVTDTGRYGTDASWARRLCLALPTARFANISGCDEPIAAPAAKFALGREQRTIAVDNESHVVAEVAARKNIPFVVARVVLDPAWRTLPPAALAPLRADGTSDVIAVMRSVARMPRQLGDLAMVTADAFRAWSELRLGCARLGRGLGFWDAAAESIPLATADGNDVEESAPYAAAV
jgi:hopanoid-associated phosphorylase